MVAHFMIIFAILVLRLTHGGILLKNSEIPDAPYEYPAEPEEYPFSPDPVEPGYPELPEPEPSQTPEPGYEN